MDAAYGGVIRGVALFAGLDARSLERIERGYSVHALPGGTYLFRQEEPARRLFLLTAGRLELSRAADDGHEITLKALEPGQVCGAVAVLSPTGIYPVSAVAAGPSVVLAWSGDLLRGIAGNDARLGVNMAELMYAHAEEIESRFGDLAEDHADRRVAGALVRLARRAGRQVAEGVLIDLPLTPHALADIAVTTLHTASSVLGRWEREGLIRAARGSVVLCDPRALSAIAGGADT